MFEIDRQEFGAFVAELRKEKGLTQKELAQRLYISDKAVSKWETGHSIPDVAMLVPLAEILGVSVTELLQCKRMEEPKPMDNTTTNELVKKVIELSEEEYSAKRKRNTLIYVICFCFAIVGQICIYYLYQMGLFLHTDMIMVFVTFLLSAIFGLYFWIFIKEKLPSYYDENQISIYVDGILHMNMPGVCYNNNNWPYIVKVLRGWSVAGMVFFPFFYLPLSNALAGFEPYSTICLELGFLLGCLFFPICIVGRKYQYGENSVKERENFKKSIDMTDVGKYSYNRSLAQEKVYSKKTSNMIIVWIIMLFLLLASISILNNLGTTSSGTRMMYFSKSGRDYWNANYQYFDGYAQKNLWVDEDGILEIQVETEEGILAVEITDTAGNILFSKENIHTEKIQVEASQKVMVRIEANKHKGSFSIE